MHELTKKEIIKEVVKSGKDVLYQVVTEDGKIYDNVKIDDFDNPIYIHQSITNSFLKNRK